jgi:hypothetical protein
MPCQLTTSSVITNLNKARGEPKRLCCVVDDDDDDGGGGANDKQCKF